MHRKQLPILIMILTITVVGIAAIVFLINKPANVIPHIDNSGIRAPDSLIQSIDSAVHSQNELGQGYAVFGFGDLTIVFDSTKRTPVPFKPKVYTHEELKEKANAYIVDVHDTVECSATDISSLYIVNGINNSGVYDYALISIHHYPFEGEALTAFEAIPKDDCRYFIRNPNTQPLIDHFLEAYDQQYKEKDLARLAAVIGGAIKEDHPLVVEARRTQNDSWVTYTNPDYGIQFDYKAAWTEPYVSENKEENQINVSFGPWGSWEGAPGRLNSLRIFINKPNVRHVPISNACPELFNTVCQNFDPTLEPDKMQRVNMEDPDEVLRAFAQEFEVNGMNAYTSRLGDAFTWNHVFISGLHNGYLFSGGIGDKDYDRVARSFKEDKDRQVAWYEERFAGYMTEDVRTCPERLPADALPKQSVGYYGGLELNGCGYDADTKKLQPYYSASSCADNFDEALGEQEYDILNGCLYYRDQQVFKGNLLMKVIYGDFGERYFLTNASGLRNGMGESASEWFRFEEKGRLYIFLRGAAGCGGCVYNGPYLVIDLRTGNIETKDSDLPYPPHNIFSPNRKKAITFDQEQSDDTESRVSHVVLSVFDFLTFVKKEIYAVPDDSSVLALGMGVFFIDDAITWLDDNRVQIQLYEGEGASEGELVTDENGSSHNEYTKRGEPIVLKVN
ncbi:hypothetical protein A3J36_00825 [Candidatus Uhrbacteria bacterium RIFCSPLOWO2_02_FULL_54_37]|uniref:Uncharacterized protein n=2 Tax=Candidatus Uhriibacteriota TaxID=1752732 RepID=A0A1F7VGM1_9BACT|nr:MAG: hypothetical protein A3J36_00825 [Candidatus Uhrbacteria bacterium RIFCSPLOWO2_02_FULL_54_37]